MLTPATKRTTATTTHAPTERINGAARPPEPVYDPLYDPAHLRVAFPPNEEPMPGAARLMTYLLMILNPLRQFFKDRPIRWSTATSSSTTIRRTSTTRSRPT